MQQVYKSVKPLQDNIRINGIKRIREVKYEKNRGLAEIICMIEKISNTRKAISVL